ncbi:MAG: U32 family peptidase [Thermodesulfobacteriota bacterium]
MELTLGPMLFEWKKQDLLAFYEEVAEMPVDTVYVGEVVCVKRRSLTLLDMERIGNMLQKAGKKPVMTTLAVISNEEELNFTREVSALPFAIEANDASVLNMVDASKKEVFAGPHIKTYNKEAINFFESLGVKRITYPIELPKETIRHNIKGSGIETEVFSHGKLPLAFSWRCYTSRAHGRKKSQCAHDCVRYPDGMELKTTENEEIFALNGTSVLSAKIFTLIENIEELREIGVSALRISPDFKHTKEAVELFRQRMSGKLTPSEGLKELKRIYKTDFTNGFYMGRPGKDFFSQEEISAFN